MENRHNYIDINKNSWNTRVDYHTKSDFYDNDSFINGENTLKDIELNLLGNIKGKSVLHLQCHFGQDTISLSRLGANATGVDFSEKAIETARDLAQITGSTTEFLCCNIYDLPKHTEANFDIVFTSYGVIGWLPDMDAWAKVVVNHLKPGGKFVFVEFHPVVWMFDDDFKNIGYNYFNSGPIIETDNGTYADKDADIQTKTVNWNHSMSEVISSLIAHGLTIRQLQEFDYSPYNCFNNTVESDPGKFRIKHLNNKIPMVYAIVAEK